MENATMNNVKKIVELGMCVGCGSCCVCEHIVFKNNSFGVPVPEINEGCTNCGKCLGECIYDPDYED